MVISHLLLLPDNQQKTKQYFNLYKKLFGEMTRTKMNVIVQSKGKNMNKLSHDLKKKKTLFN